MSSKPAIEARGLSKRYLMGAQEKPKYRALRDEITTFWRRQRQPDDWFWAVKDLDFEIAPGTILGVLGRNGAGKSTLLKLLSRITRPTEGRAVVRGRMGSLLEVGSGFHPELSGRENVYMNGSIIGMRKAEIDRRFDEIVAFAEVERFIDQAVKHYSSGMYMRLAFAVAAHLDTEILLIDEVLAVGDASFQRKCLGKVGNVARDGRTVLFVSHNMTAVRSLCNRAICLEQGRLIDDGEPNKVIDRYLFANDDSRFELDWPEMERAPGNDQVKIRRVAAMTPTGQPLAVDTPVNLEITYWNLKPDVRLNVSIMVCTMEDVCAFSSFSPPTMEPQGLVKTTCLLPAGLLNDDVYRIKIMLIKDGGTVCYYLPAQLTIQVADAARQVAWYGKWVGVVRPELSWQTQTVEASDQEEIIR